MMYEGLVSRLRKTSMDLGEMDTVSVLLLEAANSIEDLQKAVMKLEDESGLYDELPTFYIYPTKWIPVTERLPEIGKKVLVFAYGHDVLTARLRKETENDYPVFECNGIYLEMAKPGRITHWMPLPQTPKDGEP